MYPLVESIKLKNGIFYHLMYHQERLQRSMDELFPKAAAIDLAKELSAIQIPLTGLFKVRVVYGAAIEKIEIEPYNFRSVKSLKVVNGHSIDYHLKYTNRESLNFLYSQREDCDDIIIVKQGVITDSFSANLLFFNGQQWYTPDSPLLKGTKRQYLLDNGLITGRPIKAEDLASYHKVGLINAMIDFDEMPIVNIKDVYF